MPWTLKKEDVKKINSLKMWLWRRMKKIGMLNELKEGSYGQMKRRAENRDG